jgi:hypothetical protein
MTEDTRIRESWEALERAADRLQADALSFEATARRHHAFLRRMIADMAFHSFVVFLLGFVTGASLMRIFLH